MSNANADTLRTVYNAFAKGDVATVMGLLTDDIQYHISGRSLVSGDYSGKDEVLGFFGKLMQLSGGTFQLEVLDILANDEHGVTLTMEWGQREGAGSIEPDRVEFLEARLRRCGIGHRRAVAADRRREQLEKTGADYVQPATIPVHTQHGSSLV